ncbi:hypothetical protein [Limnoglobus roseus]|uniref:Actin-binding WH2 domain-containing protein n=1 Tax=Limnoglobus roseus TaxID=2598579 RepID=A0A5C1AN92_9BACT|nr:hypothetical protein [Limnoglobus roseus]QEL20035.1 hypothetical protein PX52LOC_07121 [Limnoglobus roseus]
MNAFRELDRILRGEPIGETATPLHLRPVVKVLLLLAVAYGCCMGSFGLFGREEPEFRQVVASAVKVPALFSLTLAVTFPSLYVFNTLLGTRLHLSELARVLTCGMAVLISVLAALGPIVAFFSSTTINYSFILLLNVAVFTVAGLFGVSFLFRVLARSPGGSVVVTPPAEEARSESPLPVARPVRAANVGTVFYVWLVAFGLVGAQMAWVLRPFVGSPFLPFTWFRARESSFFEAVFKSLRHLFGL